MSTAESIARALGGHPAGDGWLCRCPVPLHGQGRGDRRPSLSVHDGDDRLLVRCFAGCDPRDVLAELRRRGLLDDDGPRYELRVEPRERPEPPHEPDPDAVAIWRAAGKIEGGVAETYLRVARRITVHLPPTIRAGEVMHLGRYRFPALVAAVQRPADRTIVAVQTTALRPDGARKAPVAVPRITTGALGGGAVRLGPAGDVLGLAEGVETALSAMQISGVPVWCCLGAGRMHRVVIPRTVREVHVFADDDEPGRAAAERTAEMHSAAGRRVVIRYPPTRSKDWNDALLTFARQAAAHG